MKRDAPQHPTDPSLEALAELMDSVFRIPGLGTRFGIDALIGLIPGFGDTVSSAVSLYILNAARCYGVPRATLLRMAANIAIDYALGSIPLLGDISDVYWKANLKNVALLQQHLAVTPAEERRSRRGDWLFLSALVIGLLAMLIGSIALAYFIAFRLAEFLTRP
jgi:hypothetical protein